MASDQEILTDSFPAQQIQNNEIDESYTVEEGLLRELITAVFSYNPEEPFIFSGPVFWIFFLLMLGGYSLVYKRLDIRNLYLFLISIYFYFKTGGLFLILLVIVTLIDYFCGISIYKSGTRSRRKIFLLISIFSNIGILAYFKYTGFFIHAFNDIFGTSFQVRDFLAVFSNKLMGTSFNVGNIILPVGISFFTFQSLSYTIDVYRGKLEPVRSVIDFGFYVSFFPQLVAGPIVRASEFIPQIKTEYHLTKREFSHAMFLISKGLIKKIIISDFIAVNFVDRVFDIPTAYSGFENLIAIYGYGLQIYCDFSGYTDIAIGLALILGFRLPVNFNSPYKAHGITDFWKRWHISLSRWLKDYLYIPMGGNRKGKFRTNINLMLTMLIGGLWHGADIRFIIWGGLHGLGLITDKFFTRIFGSRTGTGRFVKPLSVFLTFQFVSFCWIFFRAVDMDHAGIMLSQIFENFLPASLENILKVYGTVFSLIAAGYLIHFLPDKVKEFYRGIFINIPIAVQMVIIFAVGLLLYQMRAYDVLPFIYFRF
ncbi:MAG: MBOAT family protein [Bacteroidales bacterium]|nr:MBOAT family protein [Bacteroidales bacterium]